MQEGSHVLLYGLLGLPLVEKGVGHQHQPLCGARAFQRGRPFPIFVEHLVDAFHLKRGGVWCIVLAAFQQRHQLLPLLLPAHERGCAEQRRHFAFCVIPSHGVSVAEGQPLLHLRQHKVAMARSIGAVGPEDVRLVVDPCRLVLPVKRDACGIGLHGLFVGHVMGHAVDTGHLGALRLLTCRQPCGLGLPVCMPGLGGGKVMLGRPLLLDKRIMPVQAVFLKTQVGVYALHPATHRRILTQGRFAFRQKLHAQSVEVGGVGRFFGGQHGQFV